MRIELMPGLDNVIRFPAERRVRPTLELLYEIAPDVREVLCVAESFGIAPLECDPCGQADREMAQRLIFEVPDAPEGARQSALAAMRERVVVLAVGACWDAHDAGRAADEARQRLGSSPADGGRFVDVDHCQAQADRLAAEAAEALVRAHVLTERARGGSHAIDLACRGEPWRARSADDDMLWLIDFQAAG